MIKIDRGIPLPPTARGRGQSNGPRVDLYPWLEMEVGDSFLLPPEPAKRVKDATAMAANASHRLRRSFACRRMPDGIRIWRTA